MHRRPHPATLKMQSTWPASITLQEHFKIFAERLEKLTSGSLKIEAMAAGQIVPAFEVLRMPPTGRFSSKAGTPSPILVGKNPAGGALRRASWRPFGMDHFEGRHESARRPWPRSSTTRGELLQALGGKS